MTNHGNLLSTTRTRGKKGLELIRFNLTTEIIIIQRGVQSPTKKGIGAPPPQWKYRVEPFKNLNILDVFIKHNYIGPKMVQHNL